MNITIEAKTGKFVMKGEELVEDFRNHLLARNSGTISRKYSAEFRGLLSTYEEEPATDV